MYDFPELAALHDAWWTAIADRLVHAGERAVPRRLTRTLGHTETWRHPHLLLGQGCEYPLAKFFAGRIRLVATPRYSAPGCIAARYRSAIVVRRDDPAECLADMRGRRCVINEPSSNSGMNLLRAAIAPLANGTRFFESVVVSGAHQRSAALVAGNQADVAALDCVTLGHLQRLYPTAMSGLRVLCWTSASPSLPFITARDTSDETLEALRVVLGEVIADPALHTVRAALFLEGVDIAPDDTFAEVLTLERDAVDAGYPAVV